MISISAVDVGALLAVDVVVGTALVVEVGVEEPLELRKPHSLVTGALQFTGRAYECLVPKTAPNAAAMAMIATRTKAVRIKNHIFGKPQILAFCSVSVSCERGPAI